MALFTAAPNLFIYISEAGKGSYFHNINQQNQFTWTRRDTRKSSDCVLKNLNSLLVHQTFNSAASSLHSISIITRFYYQPCISYMRSLIDAGFNGSFQTPPTVPKTIESQLAVLGKLDRIDAYAFRRDGHISLGPKMTWPPKISTTTSQYLPSTLHQHMCVSEETSLDSGT